MEPIEIWGDVYSKLSVGLSVGVQDWDRGVLYLDCSQPSNAMPLGLMTLSDVGKCGAIKPSICKRIYELPKSTTSAMIHQDRERAGLGLTSMHVMYAKLTCTYVTKALNDKGPLGVCHPLNAAVAE